MISYANVVQTKEIQRMWNQCFPQESESYIDYFFKNRYSPENTFVFTGDGRVQASLQRYSHEMMMYGRILQTSMIVGVATLEEYRNQGKMKALMEVALDHAEHQELITLIQAYEPEHYEKIGFETVYYRREWSIHRDQLKKMSNEGCSYEVDSAEMLVLYAEFVKHFNGYYIRDLAYFDQLKKEVEAQHGKIIAYYNDEGYLEAYGTLIPNRQSVVLEECIYMNSFALMKLVNLAAQHRAMVILKTSDNENLEVLFPKATRIDIEFMMAKVNDFDLFNRLYGCNISTTKEAFSIGKKALYINEFM